MQYQGEPLEIERKYLIRYPDLSELERRCSRKAVMSQTYLLAENGTNRRVRRAEVDGVTMYWYTEKQKISNVVRIEREREITREEYEELLREANPATRVIRKTRYNLPFSGLCFEVDIFPEWDDRAFAEVELEDEHQEIPFPDFLELIREVTEDGRYTNASLATNGFPQEDIHTAINGFPQEDIHTATNGFPQEEIGERP